MRKAHLLFAITSAAMLLSSVAAFADVKLPALISTNMVLQRDIPLKIWGLAEAGEKVTVTLDKQKVEATADKDGNWMVKLDKMSAGGPFQMVVTGKNTITLDNILIGEVWVCSGQSNMEFLLQYCNNADTEIPAAKYPKIRLFTVPRQAKGEPQKDVTGAWDQCTPDSAKRFSAVAYFFGRHIFKELKEEVPVGLIHTSWGGTMCAPWTPTDALLADKDLKAIVDRVGKVVDPKDMEAAMAEYKKKVAEWEKTAYPQDPGNKGFDKGFADPKTDLADWKACKLPGEIEDVTGIKMDGGIWFRRDVTVPDAWAGKDLTLSLGAIDDFDTTYFNNEQVGATGKETDGAYAVRRRYTVPGKFVKAGKNTIAVRVWDQYLSGGLMGPATAMTLSLVTNPDKSAPIALDGDWKYMVELLIKPVTELPPAPAAPQSPTDPGYPGSLYNGMIHPLINYGIRGAIWYQGESDAGYAYRYRKLFPTMITAWRKAWDQGDFPFLYVQLASYAAGPDWPELQEAQTMTLTAIKNVGMAVTNDIGAGKNIHPGNKQDVGKRLALIAMANTYGVRDLEYSGPLYKEWSTVKSDAMTKAIIKFTHVGGGLVSHDPKGEKVASGELTGFTIAGEDKKFVPASAKIEGDTVIVWSDKVPDPKAVRYAWQADPDPKVSLYNKEGLPASCFRTDDWPGVTSGKW